MRYTRRFTGYVHYSGTVSYPASEHGGSVSYSGEEPVYITIDVDTDAFDASVGNCNTAVNGLTSAVVATEAAQVESKRRAAKQIAATIVRASLTMWERTFHKESRSLPQSANRCL